MGKISLRAKEDKVRQKVEKTINGTIIHKRQEELAIGLWDFMVYGPSTDGKTVVARICRAEQLAIQNASVYVASLGDPGIVGQSGYMSIEELAGGDISDELRGLEVYHIAPIRPIEVLGRRESDDINKMRDLLYEEFDGKNIAIIETPDESAWSVSALHYLDRCDESFPDPLISAVRNNMSNKSLDFGRPKNSLQ